MASEFRRRTLLTWGVFGAGFYGLKRAWSTPTPDEARALAAGETWHRRPLDAFAISPDGAHVVTAARPLKDITSVVCWRVADGLPLWKYRLEGELEVDSGAPSPLSFSPDGTLLGVFSRGSVAITLEVSGGAKVGRRDLHEQSASRSIFFSQDGSELFVPSTETGAIGRVFPSRSDVASSGWSVSFDDREAFPFRLDERGLHLISESKYLIVPRAGGQPVKVADVLSGAVSEVTVTPSRRYAGVLGFSGAFATIDVQSGLVNLTMNSAVTTIELGGATGVPMGLFRDGKVWHAYGYQLHAAPLFSGKEPGEDRVFGALPVAPSPDGNRAVWVDDDGEVALWETSSGREQASLGRFEHASAVAFPTESQVVVLGPRVLAFIDLVSKLPVAQYRFPRV